MYLTKSQASEKLGIALQFLDRFAAKRNWELVEFDYVDRIKRKSKKRGYLSEEIEKELQARLDPKCEYCSKLAKYTLKNGYLCCQPFYNQCEAVIRRNIESQGFRYEEYLAKQDLEKKLDEIALARFKMNYSDLDPKQKSIVSCQHNWQVDSYSKTDSFHKQVLEPEAWNNFKSHVMPSGKTVRVQGWEGLALDHLLKLGIQEEDLITERSQIPIITLENGRRYYPDIFIKSQNRLVEVKNPWTWDRNGLDSEFREMNKSKCEASIRAGFAFTLIMIKAEVETLDLSLQSLQTL